MHRDVALGGATLAVSVVYYWVAASIPISRLADAIGPQGLPKTYALILAALSLILIGRAIREPGSGIRDRRGLGPPTADSPRPLLRAVAMLLIGVAYIATAPWLGYLLSISVLILATSYYQGGSLTRQSALVAFGGGIFFWLLFVVFLGIAQPPGFFPPRP